MPPTAHAVGGSAYAAPRADGATDPGEESILRTLSVDDRAPDFELEDGNGKVHHLSDYRGQPVVIAFYPLDFSPVCSEEHACYMDVMARFNLRDGQVLGISVDSLLAVQ